MTRRAWFNCFSGISGDMALGALLDAGADVDEVRALVDRLPVDGWTLQAEPVLRCGLAGTKVQVGATETTVHRTAANILAMIGEAMLPDRVARRALSVFEALAEVGRQLDIIPGAKKTNFSSMQKAMWLAEHKLRGLKSGGIPFLVDEIGDAAERIQRWRTTR